MFSFCFFYEATEEMEAQPQTHSDFLSLSVAIIHLWSSAVTPISFPFCSDFLLFLLSHTPCPQSSFFHASHDICRSVITNVDQWSFFFSFFWATTLLPHWAQERGRRGKEDFPLPQAQAGLLHCWLLFSCSVVSFSTPWTVAHQAPLPMGFPGKNIGVGCHFLLYGIFLTQGSNLRLLHWQADSLPLSHGESPSLVV